MGKDLSRANQLHNPLRQETYVVFFKEKVVDEGRQGKCSGEQKVAAKGSEVDAPKAEAS